MEFIQAYLSISWWQWVKLFIFLVAIYYLTNFLIELIQKNFKQRGFIVSGLERFLQIFNVLIEPIGMSILLVSFALLNPLVNGVFLLGILVIGYVPFRNYLTGILLVLNKTFSKGERISYDQQEGVIKKVGRLGLVLQLKEGIRFINYTNLVEDGFVKLEGDRLEGIKSLEIIPTDKAKNTKISAIKDKLFACPYLDWQYSPQVSQIETADEPRYQVTLRVTKDQHLQHLMSLMQEWGYDCKVI